MIALAVAIAVAACAAVIAALTALIAHRLAAHPAHVFRSLRPRGAVSPPFHRPELAAGLEQVKCPHCSGGTQWLHPDTGWGKIPQDLLFRRWDEDERDYDCRPPIPANLRSCPHCAGFGSTYRDPATELK